MTKLADDFENEDFGNEAFGRHTNGTLVIETDGSIELVDTLKICENGITKVNFNIFDNNLNDIYSNDLAKIFYCGNEKNHKNLNTQLSNQLSNKNDLGRTIENTQLNQWKDNINLYQQTIQAYHQLKRDLAEWELMYLIKPSIQGKLSYLQIWSESQVINQGQTLFSVVPNHNKYIAKLQIPNTNSGKIKLNQKVIIRLANYPDREFGLLQGKIASISLTPNQDGLLMIDVELPNQLQTTYQKKLDFQQEMSGIADIVTEDLRLIERLLYQFRDIFTRQ
jgi:hypothetical protein